MVKVDFPVDALLSPSFCKSNPPSHDGLLTGARVTFSQVANFRDEKDQDKLSLSLRMRTKTMAKDQL
jgi:hypothetical protein